MTSDSSKPRNRSAVQQEVIDLIQWYEDRGDDWTSAAEFTLARESGTLDIVLKRPYVRPFKYPKLEEQP